MTRPLPNAIIGGAQKSGTTTLHRLLESHPRTFTPAKHQEIHFFDVAENYARGLEWYASHFSGWRGEPVVFQTSPLYLYQPEVPERIQAAEFQPRFLFVLRNPVDRAYSHYWHEIRFGRETLSFEAAIEREPERIPRGFEARRHFSYLDRGRYARQLVRFIDRFGRERVLVLFTEDLARDPVAVGRAMGRFLDLETDDWEEGLRGRNWRRNPGKLPRIAALQRLALGWRQRFPGLVYLLELLNLRSVRYPSMDPATRYRLIAAFEEEISALESLLGIELDRWREGAVGAT